MLRRYTLDPIVFTLRIGITKYLDVETLEHSLKKNYKILKKELNNKKVSETCYSLVKDDKEVAFIRGYYINPTRFKISRIKNATKDKVSGYKFLSRLFPTMEKNLQNKGVKYISTLCLAKIAPIIVKRYGFRGVKGQSYEQLRKKQSRKIPFTLVSLEKRL